MREAGGALIAELRKPAGSSVELGLEAGSYVVAVENGGAVKEAQLTLAAGEHLALAGAAFHPGAPLEVAVARGDDDAAAADTPSGPAAVATATPAEPPHETTSFKAGFIPRAVDGRTDVEGFSFGFIADRAARLRGAQLSLGYNQIDGSFRGLQLTTAVNVAGSFTTGTQIAAGANLAGGNGHGVQIAAGANVFDGDFRGWQSAAGVNVTTGRFHGLQSAAGLNLTDEGSGLQLAGGANVARTFHGSQIGVLNIATAADGFRLGVVNVAHETHGFQFGVVNVAAHDDGESFAILNLIGNGIHGLSVYGTDALLSNVALQLGGRHLYTSFSFSFQPGDTIAAGPIQLARGSQRWGYGGGLGWRQPIGSGPLHHLDVEAVTTNLVPELSSGDGVMLDTLRVTLALAVLPKVSVLVGAGVNVMVGTDGRDFSGLGVGWGSTYHDGATTVRLYPGFLLGLQL